MLDISPSLARWTGRAAWTTVWTILRLRATTRGIAAEDLERVRSCLKARYGLEEPDSSHPLQRPRNLFPRLTARPWHAADDFAWTAVLQESASHVREELAALLADESFLPYRSDLALQGRWTTFMLWRFDRPVLENLTRCPVTADLLDTIPQRRGAGLAYFSALAPGSRVAPHCGPTNTRLRCHLGLDVPIGCEIRVGSETRSWEEDRCLVFWHPDLTPAEIWAVREAEKLTAYALKRRLLGRR